MQIINQAKVTFQYRKSHSSPIIVKNINSNVVVTHVICNFIQITKKVNKYIAYSFDILTYEIIIKNKGDYSIKNILFKDLIPKSTCYIFNSINVNGKKEKCKNPCKGIWIDKLECGESIIITFDVVVKPNFCIKKIINYGCVSYDFLYNIEKKPIRPCIKSNEVCTLKQNLFKSINVKGIINLKERNIITTTIYKIYIWVDLLNAKIITGLKNNMILIIGRINCEIRYKKSLKIYTDVCSKGFSEFVFVPRGGNYFDEYLLFKNIKLYVEDSNYTFLNYNKIFIDSQILIEV